MGLWSSSAKIVFMTRDGAREEAIRVKLKFIAREK